MGNVGTANRIAKGHGVGSLKLEGITQLIEAMHVPDVTDRGFSVQDIVRQTGIHRSTANQKIAKLIRDGKAKLAGHALVPNIVGHASQVPVYELVKE